MALRCVFSVLDVQIIRDHSPDWAGNMSQSGNPAGISQLRSWIRVARLGPAASSTDWLDWFLFPPLVIINKQHESPEAMSTL